MSLMDEYGDTFGWIWWGVMLTISCFNILFYLYICIYVHKSKSKNDNDL